jgi:hypothetical protein
MLHQMCLNATRRKMHVFRKLNKVIRKKRTLSDEYSNFKTNALYLWKIDASLVDKQLMVITIL